MFPLISRNRESLLLWDELCVLLKLDMNLSCSLCDPYLVVCHESLLLCLKRSDGRACCFASDQSLHFLSCVESVRDAVGRKVKLSLRKRVKLEIKGDKTENRVLVSPSFIKGSKTFLPDFSAL